MEKEHVKCYTSCFETYEIKLFIDTGADTSLIKLSALKKYVIINNSGRRTISGITASTVELMGLS